MKGDKEAVKDLSEYAKRVSKEKPSVINERVNQMYEDYAGGEEQARKARALDDQNLYAKRTKRVREEVVGEKARVEEAKAKAAPKEGKAPTKAQLAKEELKAKAAEKFPESKAKYRQAKSELSNAKAKLRVAQKAKSPKAELAKLENSVARLESNLETVGDDLKKVAYERKAGTEYKTKKDLHTYAENEAENVREKLKSKSDSEILKDNSLEKLAQEYKSRRAIPGSEKLPNDTQIRLLDAREKAFTKRLDKVKSELKYAGDEASKLLEREKDVLNKLIKQAQGRRLVHRRRQGLQEMGKTLERQEKLKGKLAESPSAKAAREKAFKAGEQKIKQEAKASAEKFLKEMNKEYEKVAKKVAQIKNDPSLPSGAKKKKISKLWSALKTMSLGRAAAVFGIPASIVSAGSAIWKEATGEFPITTFPRLVKWGADKHRVQKALKMKRGDRLRYYRELRSRGTSAKRISQIAKEVKRAA